MAETPFYRLVLNGLFSWSVTWFQSRNMPLFAVWLLCAFCFLSLLEAGKTFVSKPINHQRINECLQGLLLLEGIPSISSVILYKATNKRRWKWGYRPPVYCKVSYTEKLLLQLYYREAGYDSYNARNHFHQSCISSMCVSKPQQLSSEHVQANEMGKGHPKTAKPTAAEVSLVRCYEPIEFHRWRFKLSRKKYFKQ